MHGVRPFPLSNDDAPLPIEHGWQLTETPAGAAATPGDLSADDDLWLPASVPGTVAGALSDLGRWSLDRPAPLADRDWWYRNRFTSVGPERFRFEGLANIAEVWIDGRRELVSDTMFEAHEIDVPPGDHTIFIAFRSLDAHLGAATPAGRWRPRMIEPSSLRRTRTTLLGHMPGWCPPVDAIGPYRPIVRIAAEAGIARATKLAASLLGTTGRLEVEITTTGTSVAGPATVACAGSTAELATDSGGRLSATLEVPNVAPWYPHPLGDPVLHDVTATIGGTTIPLGRVGFRCLAVDRDTDGKGFGIVVNGLPLFCRGAVWAASDVVGLDGSRAHLEPLLRLVREAGMTMLRVTGTSLYPSDDFYALCDELGILVWQDLMLANFDYPHKDDAWRQQLTREVEQFLARTQTSPSLAVVCGGSEVFQQAAMLGFPKRFYETPLFTDLLPGLVEQNRPDVVWVANSPSSGSVPFAPNEGAGHYYGVGAYQRPLEDARRANVRFASETLAFAHVPEPVTLEAKLAGIPAVHDPRWKERVPRDVGASWDFEDVRDHYLARCFEVDPPRLRYENPERYLALSRAVTAHLMEQVFAEWQRPGSPARGGLVWLFQDLWPGAGWGIVDSCGEPKSPWYALRRAFQPVRVTMTDEGTNGLAIHIANETAEDRTLSLALVVHRDGRPPLAQGRRVVNIAARSAATLDAYDILGAFLDLNYAYRFGPLDHSAVEARLTDDNAASVVADAFYFPKSRIEPQDIGLSARLEECGASGDAALVISCTKVARFVHIDDANYRPEDNWFHLASGRERMIRLTRRACARTEVPFGTVTAVNASAAVTYGRPQS